MSFPTGYNMGVLQLAAPLAQEQHGHCEYCEMKAKWDFRLAVVRTGAAVVAVLCAVIVVASSL